MKIKRLEFCNIGPYRDTNIMKFDIDQTNKNIVLFGGKNGTGKTTLFNAIKIAIYGCKAYNYDAPNSSYFQEVEKIINVQIKTSSNRLAYVLIDILIDDGKDNNVYSIKREWILKGVSIKENCSILKNGVFIKGDELQNFIAFLDNMVPADLFNFYFFDGEKIGEYFLSAESKHNFRKAFLTICGLDSISLLVENFERIYRKNAKGSKAAETYYAVKEEIIKLEEERDSLKAALEKNDTSYIILLDQKKGLEQEYLASGGVSLNTWNEINRQLLEEEGKRELSYKRLREIALTELPFIIIKDKINDLEKQIDQEHCVQKYQILKSILTDKKNIELIAHYYESDLKKATKLTKLLLCGILSSDEIANPLLGLSVEDEQRLVSFIAQRKMYSKSEISTLYSTIDGSLKKAKKARKKLEMSSVDKIDDFMRKINDLTSELLKLKDEHESITNKLMLCEQSIQEKTRLFEKAKKDYEKDIKDNSINNIAGKAFWAYKETEEILIKKFSKELEEKFIFNFKSIINKDEFIDGINVDEKLNVKPYKNITYAVKDIKQMINNYGQSYLLDNIGVLSLDSFDSAVEQNQKEVILPVAINSPLSQGEKQVYIMSLYISLLQISNNRVPFIIDTPFARIDSEHRSKIVEVFFKKLGTQVFILSTDEEIVGESYNKLKDRISNKLLLQSTKHGYTSITEDKYFGGCV